jgi:hypothetical protein
MHNLSWMQHLLHALLLLQRQRVPQVLLLQLLKWQPWRFCWAWSLP